jgi:hypothetical protein
MAVMLEDGSIRDVGGSSLPAGFRLFAEPVDYVDGTWIVVETSGPITILKKDLASWRVRRSEELLRELPQDPETRIESLKVASSLRGFDLEDVVRKLKNKGLPGESLTDAFLRIKNRG